MTTTRVRVAVCAVTVLASASCARPTPTSPAGSGVSPAARLTPSAYPASTSGTGPPAPPMPPSVVTGSDVDQVALAAVRAVESVDTTLDAGPGDTLRRAAAWLTPGFAAQVRAFAPVAATGASWDRWAAHRAYVVVSTSLAADDHPPDTPTSAYRQIVAVLHPVGRDGWTGPAQTEVAFVTLAPVAGQWRLASLRTS